jgi:RNA-directed DNA polymerase
MMHDREKSDSAIVAKKSANKAGRSAAERMEPRAGTKRNAIEQSTHRTQDRARVTQALDRVRQAARQRRKEKGPASESLHGLGRKTRSAEPAWSE